MACTYNLDGKVFTSEQDLDTYLLSTYLGVGFQKMTQDEIYNGIRASQEHILFFEENGYTSAAKYAEDHNLTLEINEESQKRGEDHKYFFIDGKKLVEAISVTTKIDIKWRPTFTVTPQGAFSQIIGTRYHHIADEVLRNEGAIPKGLSGLELDWANRAAELYKEWSDGGKNKILTEFKILNKYSKMAGTVDVAIISPDGKVRLVDFKFSRHPYNFADKLWRNSMQLAMYDRMMSIGEPEIEFPAVEIEDASIMHVKLEIEGEYDEEAENNGFDLVGANFYEDLVSYEEGVLKKYRRGSKSSANSAIKNRITEAKKKARLTGEGSVPYTSFYGMTGALDINDLPIEKIVNEAANQKARKDANGRKRFYYRNQRGEDIYYTDRKAQQDNEEGRQARIDELYRDYVPVLERLSTNAADEAINYFMTGTTDLFNEEEQNPNLINTRRVKLEQLLSYYDKDNDYFELLESVEGFENVGSDVIIVYRNFDAHTGDYSSVDLISIDTTGNTRLNPNKDKSNTNKNIFNKYLTDWEAKELAKRIEAYNIIPFENTDKNNKLVKMGIIAMQLKKNNPNLLVNDLIALPLTSDTKRDSTVRAPMKEVLSQIKLLSKLNMMAKEDDGQPIDLQGILGEEVYDLITSNDELYDYTQYGRKETEFYFDFIANQLMNDNVNLEHHYENIENLFKELIILPESGESSDNMRQVIAEIKRDNEKKKELLRLLGKRQQIIEDQYRGSERGRGPSLENSLEYQFINTAIRELHNITDDLNKVTALHWIKKLFTSSGFLGIPIVDSFTKKVKEAMSLVSRHYLNGMVVDGKKEESYKKRKDKAFEKLLSENRSKARRRSLGDDYSIYHQLLEEKWFEIDDVDSRNSSIEDFRKIGAKWIEDKGMWMVKRRTGRFWTKDTAREEGITLTDNQWEFIEWFNDIVEEGYTRTMPDYEKETFKDRWIRGWVPAMRSTTADIMYKALLDREEGKETTKQRVRDFWDRFINRFKNMQEFFDTDVEDMYTLMTVFDKQMFKSTKEISNPYGPPSRLYALGLIVDPVSNTIRASTEYKDLFETDLESILDMFQISSIRKYHMDPLIVLYKAVKNGVALAEHQYFGQFEGVQEYLRIYVENAFLNKRQIPKNDLQRKAEAFGASVVSTTASAVIGFNLFSWMKNFEAGYLHTLGNSIAKLVAGKADFPAYRRAALNVFHHMSKTKGGPWTNKLHSIMYSMALGDMDPERLVNDKRYKVGNKQMFQSWMSNWGNLAGDYVHRSIMTAAKMEVDGTWKAYEQDPETGEWKYNENLDPRFEGKKGESLKQAVKQKMAEEGSLDENGNMVVPYTTDEIMHIKKESDLTFENQTSQDQQLYRQYVAGTMLMQMQSWLASKKERWYTERQETEHLGHWETVEVINKETGEPEYVTTWKGHFMEGIYQTMGNIGAALQRHVTGKENISDYWAYTTDKEKENVGRFINDVGVAGTLYGSMIFILGALGDDDDWRKNKTLYYLTMGAVQEIFVLEHLRAASGMLTNPFPSTAIALRLIQAMTSLEPRRMWNEGAKYLGPIKLIPLSQTALGDFGVIDNE